MTKHTDEEFDQTRRRANAYAEANIKANNKIVDMIDELSQVKQMLARTESELAAERNTMQMINDDNNRRYQSANQEVERLRNLLKEHGINPG
jgi:hypothetical protein